MSLLRHAAGLVGKMRGTMAEIKLSDLASKLYPTLEAETGLQTGVSACMHTLFVAFEALTT